MTDDQVAWLVGEVRELLDASSVGLYEFIWLLRSVQPTTPVQDLQITAQRALEHLLSAESGRLVLLEWPNQEAVGYVDPGGLSATDWDDPRQGLRYVALARN